MEKNDSFLGKNVMAIAHIVAATTKKSVKVFLWICFVIEVICKLGHPSQKI